MRPPAFCLEALPPTRVLDQPWLSFPFEPLKTRLDDARGSAPCPEPSPWEEKPLNHAAQEDTTLRAVTCLPLNQSWQEMGCVRWLEPTRDFLGEVHFQLYQRGDQGAKE